MEKVTLSCRCGACRIEAEGPPIQAVICHCTSCRTAAERIESMPAAPRERDAEGGTGYVMHRKDRLRLVTGAEKLAGFRLTPDSKTRRAVATCCNTLFFTDFQPGHWLSINSARWPEAQRPAPALRTMTGDRKDAAPLPGDIPNPKSHNFGFFWRLIRAWAAMRFRTPKLDYPTRELFDG